MCSADVSIIKVLKPQLYFWTFNTADGPFANEKVRLAMRYLIDYDGLSKSVTSYLGVPRASFVQLGAVTRFEPRREARHAFGQGIENAAVLPDAFETLRRIGGVAVAE